MSDPVHGTLRHLASGDRALDTIFDPDAPEGIALLPDGRLVVAEQRLNRIVTLRLPGRARTTLFELPSAGTAAGVDGIAYDVHGARLLVPDSPHGTLLAVSVSDGGARPLAAGLGRDVGAVVGPDGAVWVAVEGSRGLWRVPASGGTAEPVGRLSQLDDVVSAGGLLYATALLAGEVVAIDPRTGNDAVLVTGIGSDADSAQGLAVLADGRLAVADSSAGVVAALAPCR